MDRLNPLSAAQASSAPVEPAPLRSEPAGRRRALGRGGTAQARGEEPIPEGTLRMWKTSGRLIVAVCDGGPISVKLPEKK